MDRPSVITEIQETVARIWLNRPDFRNALNLDILGEFIHSLQEINADPRIRLIILRGRGPAFCSGADLNWMQQAWRLSPEDNYKESSLLAHCFFELYASPKITLAVVHGAAFGGAMGLIAASDMAVSTETAEFAFSEVKLGLVPAAISPFIFHKSGKAKVLEYMLTGRRFRGPEAALLGLINRAVPDEQLDEHLDGLITELLHTAPGAQLTIKKMFRSLDPLTDHVSIDQAASLLAETRVSDEAREGIRAFLEKRQPTWTNA
jgi:methylglutaconyl-CoA hydratase